MTPAAYRVPGLEFGAWPVNGELVELDGVSGFVEAEDPGSDPGVPAYPWKAPAPLSPNHREALFTAGARFQHPHQGSLEILEPVAAGLLHLPSGRVVVTDPPAPPDRIRRRTVLGGLIKEYDTLV